MYNLNDTIVAVSSPGGGARSIIRITGPVTVEICEKIFRPTIAHFRAGLINGCVAIDNEMEIDAVLYLSLTPRSYTGDDVAEIHLYASAIVTEKLIDNLLTTYKVRIAGPGEFTVLHYFTVTI